MNRIVDASVVVKWLVAESGSDRATTLMRQPVIAPDTLIPECLNALRKKVGRRELSEEDAQEAAQLLSRAEIVLEPTQRSAPDILALSLKLSLTTYDCAYLVVARRLDGVLVTADERLLARCRRADVGDLAQRVRSLYEETPMIQERPARPYLPRRRKVAVGSRPTL